VSSQRHRWNGGATCAVCGLRREAAGEGSYGAVQYYRDEERGRRAVAGPCVGADGPRRERAVSAPIKPRYLNVKGREAARYWGSECEANPETTFSEDYAVDCALKYGRESWAECTSAEKSEILGAFREGRASERKATGRE